MTFAPEPAVSYCRCSSVLIAVLGVGLSLALPGIGCSFRSGLEGSQCSPDGSRREGFVCRNGHWVPTENGGPDKEDSGRCSDPPCDGGLETDGSDAEPPTDSGQEEDSASDTSGPEEDTDRDTIAQDTTDTSRDTTDDTDDGGDVDGGGGFVVCKKDSSSEKCDCESGETCNIECDGSQGECETECKSGSTCTVRCTDAPCDLKCKDGATCHFVCDNNGSSGTCETTCETKASGTSQNADCNVDCVGTGPCTTECKADVVCAVNCSNAGDCSPVCKGGATSCTFTCADNNAKGTCNPACENTGSGNTCSVHCDYQSLGESSLCRTTCKDHDSCDPTSGSCQIGRCGGERESNSDNGTCELTCSSD